MATEDAVREALATVNDPEIHRPITELGMVKSVEIAADGAVAVTVYLTVSGCPMRETITKNVTDAVAKVEGVTRVDVTLDVMSDEQRKELASSLRGGTAEREVPFAKPGSLTRVYAVASGKGGVGKSSVTVNLAAAMVADGLKVGVVDADIYGHSVPRMLGADGKPTQVENMIMPPSAYGVKVISIGMFTPGNAPVVWRGPMLHRALQQFLADVYWGDLDVLLLDLPPGTGDIAISVAQLVPNAEILVVTTPQQAAAEVAERAGSIAVQTHQKIVGVVENMSGMPCPHCDEMVDVFGTGGGRKVAEGLTKTVGAEVPVLGSIPIDVRLREGGDEGKPVVLSDPDSPAARRCARSRSGWVAVSGACRACRSESPRATSSDDSPSPRSPRRKKPVRRSGKARRTGRVRSRLTAPIEPLRVRGDVCDHREPESVRAHPAPVRPDVHLTARRPRQHPPVLGLAVVERHRNSVHRQGQHRPRGTVQIVGEFERRLRLLVQPVVAQCVVQLRGPGVRQQARAGQPGGGRHRGRVQDSRTVAAAPHGTAPHGHHDREPLLVTARVAPDQRLVTVPGRSVLHRAVGRRADLHQPALTGEGLVQSVPGERRLQIAVDRTPGRRHLLFGDCVGRTFRACPTCRLHLPGRLLDP